MKQAEHEAQLKEINRRNARYWGIQAEISREYREHASTAEEVLRADELDEGRCRADSVG